MDMDYGRLYVDTEDVGEIVRLRNIVNGAPMRSIIISLAPLVGILILGDKDEHDKFRIKQVV